MQVLMINLNRFQYKNIDSAEKLIRYITRNRENEDRRNELLGYGINYGTDHCKCQHKNVGFISYKHVGKPTRLYEIF